MKHLNGYDNMFETESWYLYGNMNALLGYLNRELGTKGQFSDPGDKTFWVCVLSAMFLTGQTFC